MLTPAHGFAVIDGSLCELGQFGSRSVLLGPMATAIAEFRRGPLCTYVRELPHGLLPGLANLYCLDGAGRLVWIAEWPLMDDPCAAIVDEHDTDGVLTVKSVSGAEVRIDTATGRLLGWAPAMAAAG
ncbi:MAG TPA: hypothetical protein VG710_10085 [Opitutus sp.]|nr:hypothetical protein [Opitutus sp.]